jgi:hypothetical protein
LLAAKYLFMQCKEDLGFSYRENDVKYEEVGCLWCSSAQPIQHRGQALAAAAAAAAAECQAEPMR